MKKNIFESNKKYNYNFTKLTDKGFKIKNQRKLSAFCYNYGFSRVINGYAACLLDSHSNFVGEIDTNQLLKLAKFDRKLGIILLESILDFEARFNSILVSSLLKFYNLENDYVLTYKNSNWLEIESSEIKKKLISNLYQSTDSNLLKSYTKIDINRIKNDESSFEPPLSTLSLSWTFGTLINLFEFLNPKLQNDIIKECLNTNISTESFLWLCNVVRKLRNKITHNDFILVSRFKVNEEIKKYLNMDKNNNFLQIKHIANFLDKVDWFNKLSFFSKSLQQRIEKLVYKFRFKYIVKRKTLKYLGYEC
ncbi:MAG: Abi family protein [Candidatus Ureaplasma intestinipullorum]|uniref:Abi family protein n=1 Tax=Candidatus Ureaplasma intestinipullorum TaxID=2838770 RepID=A0A9E2NVY1_9BACT|nr:Abi family protein [Candidatus Ureaplasma intestinipullorum]